MGPTEGAPASPAFTVDFILDIINEFKTMRKYLQDTTEIDQIILELNTMLKYANH